MLWKWSPGDIRTDLALEAHDLVCGEATSIPGVRVERDRRGDVAVSRVRVLTDEAGQSIGKPPGSYITIDAPGLRKRDPRLQEQVSAILAEELAAVLSGDRRSTVMVVGLGNWNATPDALGPRVVQNILITRHLQDFLPPEVSGRLRPVCAVAPGVLGLTGIETSEIIRGIVDRVRPDLVIAVDALAAGSLERIMTTIQIADSGIHPGSGVGNKRIGITAETLGVPVIAIGCPTVVHAVTIACETIDVLLEQFRGQTHLYRVLEEMGNDKHYLINEVLSPSVGDLMVTPKEIDVYINELAGVISAGINTVLHPDVDPEDVARYLT